MVESFQALVGKYYSEATTQASSIFGDAKEIYSKNEKQLANILDFYTTTSRNGELFSDVRKEAFKIVNHKMLKQVVTYTQVGKFLIIKHSNQTFFAI